LAGSNTYIGNFKNKVRFRNVGSGAYSCDGKGTRILVLSVQRLYCSHPCPLSYLFFAPDRSCNIKPETNMSNTARKIGPRIAEYCAS
jgi:hypothetical protein